jgi:hypothetical protein
MMAMDDFVWLAMLSATAAVTGYYWYRGRQLRRRLLTAEAQEKFGADFIEFAQGLADLILSVPALSVIIFIMAVVGGDDGLSGLPLVVGGSVYVGVCALEILGLRRWLKRIRPALNGTAEAPKDKR